MKGIKIIKKNANDVRVILISKKQLCTKYKVRSDEDYVYFPLISDYDNILIEEIRKKYPIELDDYEYYEFENNDKKGYLRITKNNEDFFVELCYNYAIIEVEVEESELHYAVSRGITILKSIRYNDLVIEKYINDNDLESSETIFKIPEPKEKDDTKNILQYIEDSEKED
jgi:tRNA G37 N-methylase Trm5